MGKGHCEKCGGHTAGNCCNCGWHEREKDFKRQLEAADELRLVANRQRDEAGIATRAAMEQRDEARTALAAASSTVERLRARCGELERLLCELVATFVGATVTTAQAQLIIDARDLVMGAPPAAEVQTSRPNCKCGHTYEDHVGNSCEGNGGVHGQPYCPCAGFAPPAAEGDK